MPDQIRIVEDDDELRALWTLQTLAPLRRGKIISMGEYNACVQVACRTQGLAKCARLMDLVCEWEADHA